MAEIGLLGNLLLLNLTETFVALYLANLIGRRLLITLVLAVVTGFIAVINRSTYGRSGTWTVIVLEILVDYVSDSRGPLTSARGLG